MIKISVSDSIRSLCPDFVGAAIQATVTNTASCSALWQDLEALAEQFKSSHTHDTIKAIPTIAATRQIYKLCGKDPSRYRPSAEALCRRIVRGQALYQINTLVDLINYVSIRFGFSIGGFDADKIVGDRLELGIGQAGEPYEGIGRGSLNIEGLPVYRDTEGGIGTPTSDHERTKITLHTTHVLILINGYSGELCMHEATQAMRQALTDYASAIEITTTYY